MRRTSILANPTLVGAVTVLVTTVAVFLAYNANNGLPFVPTTALQVQVSNGANLVRGNEVRSGGYRIGVISDMRPIRLSNGEAGAELSLKLDKSIGEIPKDTQFVVRARSALGLKYLEMNEGRSKESYVDGDTVAFGASTVPVDLDEVYNMFDERTREGSQQSLQGFGDGFAGRGEALGQTIEDLPRLFRVLEPVMANLADEDTELRNFFKELGDTARVVAPVSARNAQLFTFMADTFEAIGRDPEALRSFIEKGPPTLDVSTDSLEAQRPFLSAFADFSEELVPAASELRATLPGLNNAIDRGTPVLARGVRLNDDLADTMVKLDELAQAPTTNAAIRALTATVTTLNPQLRFYGPTITVCNGWSYFWTFAAEHFTEEDISGQAQRALLNHAGRQDNSLGSQDARRPANGQNVTEGNAQYLKAQDYPHAITEDGKADCESGQRGWTDRQAKVYPKEYRITRDPPTPGVQGPTYRGFPQVAPGQTFTRNPQTGGFKDMPQPEFGER